MNDEAFAFRRDGTPITDARELERLLGDLAYKRVAETTVELGGRKAWISTVWLGIDHNFRRRAGRGGAPVIFETMVFADAIAPLHEEQERYETEEAARLGHERWVAKTREVLEELARASG